MLFVDFQFLLFFCAAFVVSWSLRGNTARKAWLLFCSYAFYAAWDWRFLSLILVSTWVDYIAGLRIHGASSKGAKRGWLLASIATNLGMLGFFKYWNFFIESANELAQWVGFASDLPALHIILPVGISFFTFQTLSYSIDIYRGGLRPTRNLLDISLFVAFFPQLVAGPIVRARDFLPQLATLPGWKRIEVRALLVLFLVGFFKKACIADGLAPFVDQYFAAPELYDALSSWIAVLFYAVQIYCDFSGYSEMAIATAGLLGYRLTDNFAHPYFAANISAFWRRWHISLSTWMRDYVYIPLGGNRGKHTRTLSNLAITMLLGGLWHGAAWSFVIWGALHGLGLVVHQLWSRSVAGTRYAAMKLLGTGLTFYWVCLCWIPFRTGSLLIAERGERLQHTTASAAELVPGAGMDGLAHTLSILKAFVLFDSPGEQSFGASRLGLFAALASLHALAFLGLPKRLWERVPSWLFALGYGVAWAIALQGIADTQAFIYFQF